MSDKDIIAVIILTCVFTILFFRPQEKLSSITKKLFATNKLFGIIFVSFMLTCFLVFLSVVVYLTSH